MTYPREFLRTFFYLRSVAKCLRYVVAGFFKDELGEATLCSPFPAIPGHPDLCNFTNPELGNSWFCGKPRKPGLSCADWKLIRDLEFTNPLPLNEAEKSLQLQLMRHPQLLRVVKPVVSIVVNKGSSKPPWFPVPCASYWFRDTWKLGIPRGYFKFRKWIRTDCQQLDHTPTMNEVCLTNTTVVLAGDSLTLPWFDILAQRLRCNVFIKSGKTWHRKRSCIRSDIRFAMFWQHHGFPAHPLANQWAPKSHFRSVASQIDAVPSSGRYIVVVHLYLHLTIHHYHVFLERVRSVRRATEKLIQRNPEAIVAIKGPHTAANHTEHSPLLAGDMMGPLMREIIVSEFRSLRERVLFLDFWDMTIAAENVEVHPEPFVNHAMVNVFMDHVCGISPRRRTFPQLLR